MLLLRRGCRGFSTSVRIVEVGPRDGLQNEASVVPTDVKVKFISLLAAAGLPSVEVASFVSPKWVPQMADAAAVVRLTKTLAEKRKVSLPVLVPNVKGLRAALDAGAREVAVFAAASETFSRKNTNCLVEEALERFRQVFAEAKDVPVRGYVSCVVGCPYEGHVSPAAVARVAGRLADMGCYEISLGDTIGVGTPGTFRLMLNAVKAELGGTERLAVHCHDTYGQALANIMTALDEDVRVVDSSAAGLGGCPYAGPGASGNVATEDVVYMLNGCGVDTGGVDLEKVIDAGEYITEQLDRPNMSKVARAMRARNDTK